MENYLVMNINDLDSIVLLKVKNHIYIIHKNYIYVLSLALGISFGYCFGLVVRKLLKDIENRLYRKIKQLNATTLSSIRGGKLTPEQAFEKCLQESGVYESIDSQLNKLILSMFKTKVRDGLLIISEDVYILAKVVAAKKIVNLHALGIEIKAESLPTIIRTSKNIFQKSFNTGSVIASLALAGIQGLIIATLLLSAINTGAEVHVRQQCSHEVVPYERVQPAQDNMIYLDPQVSRESRVIVTDHEELVVVESQKPLSESVEITQSENGLSIDINKDNVPSLEVSNLKTQTLDDVQKHDDTESRREVQTIVGSRKSKPKKKVPLSKRTQTLEGLKKEISDKEAQDSNEPQDDIIEDDFVERVWNNLD